MKAVNLVAWGGEVRKAAARPFRTDLIGRASGMPGPIRPVDLMGSVRTTPGVRIGKSAIARLGG